MLSPEGIAYVYYIDKMEGFLHAVKRHNGQRISCYVFVVYHHESAKMESRESAEK